MRRAFFLECAEAIHSAHEIARIWPLLCGLYDGNQIGRGNGDGRHMDCLYLRSGDRKCLLFQYQQHIREGKTSLRLMFYGPAWLKYATIKAHPAVWKYHSPPVFLPPPTFEHLAYWRYRDDLRHALRQQAEGQLYA